MVLTAIEQALCRGRHDGMIDYRLGTAFPVKLLAGPIRLGGHHARDGMSESILDCAMRLLAATHAFEPVGHMPERQIINLHRRH